MELKDFDRMTLQPGETLVLRARRAVPAATLERMHDYLRRNGFRAIVVDNQFDIMVVQEMQPAAEDAASDDDIMAEIKAAYDAGQVIQWCAMGSREWFDAHRVASPIKFDPTCNAYRLRVKP
jgi:adenine deaminase